MKKALKTCEYCGNKKNRVDKNKEFNMMLCECCKKTLKEHPVLYIPPIGELHYDSEGKVICHICGRAYNNLSNHITQAHNIKPNIYKEMFGLNRGTKLTSKSSSERLSKSPTTKNIDLVRIPFQKGHTANKGKKRRLEHKLKRHSVKSNIKNEGDHNE